MTNGNPRRSESMPYRPPPSRKLKAFAFDPSLPRAGSMTIDVPWEPLSPGPSSSLLGLSIVDYDATNDCYYPPVDLDSWDVLIRGGLDASEFDPQFHQQMVYAVMSQTIYRFWYALGRKPTWNSAVVRKNRGIDGRLRVMPHAMQDANAFYARDLGCIAFGYFPASEIDPGINLPGQVVFTCLSHDIVVHETAHALIDGQKRFFLEATSLDAPAFHEAFADIVALFQHFTHKEPVVDVIQRTGGMLYRSEIAARAASGPDGPQFQEQLATSNPLVDLARQFGEAMGSRSALRQALGSAPNSQDLDRLTEPHARGAVLVAAVFDAFFSIYTRRTEDLLRMGRAAGDLEAGHVHPDLADRLAREAMKTAQHFSNICIRALDYCPPVDIQFGEFLRAMITADYEVVQDDPLGYRQALIEAFRLRGIPLQGVKSYAEESVRWDWTERGEIPACDGLHFDPFDPPTREQNRANAVVLSKFGNANAVKLGLNPDRPVQAHNFHPILRVGPDGDWHLAAVAEFVQKHDKVPLFPDDPSSPTFSFRGGTTVIFDWAGEVLYAVRKPLGDLSAANARLARQREYYSTRDGLLAAATYVGAPATARSQVDRPLSALDLGGSTMRFDLITEGISVAGSIRIRMYRVGFGDCFLVSLTSGEQGQTQRHILIDCGVHNAGSLGNMQKVVDNVAEVTGGSLAVVIASHAHQDHISGFAACAASFDELRIREVWLPWTDNLADPRARDLAREHFAALDDLNQHVAALKATKLPVSPAAIEALANLTGNERAMQNLRAGFRSRARVRYLKAGQKLRSPARIAGLEVQVLGPPEDEAFLSRMHPPKSQRYLRLVDGEAMSSTLRPFATRWRREIIEVGDDPAFDRLRLSDKERQKFTEEFAGPTAESLAFALDQARNNTSLVLLLRFGGKTLLFPGDAQYGSWRWWLDNLESGDILSEVDFLKVSHHGSHNASPRDAIEHLPEGFAAMVSTQNEPWDSIPREPLLTRLGERTAGRVLRSDSLPLPERPDAPAGPVLNQLPPGFSKGAFWYDYTLDL